MDPDAARPGTGEGTRGASPLDPVLVRHLADHIHYQFDHFLTYDKAIEVATGFLQAITDPELRAYFLTLMIARRQS